MEPDEYKPKASAKVRTRYRIVLVTKYRKWLSTSGIVRLPELQTA